MEPEGSLPHSQVPATCLYSESAQSSPYPHIPLPEEPSHLHLGLPSGLFPSGFRTKTLYTPLPSPLRATCPAHLILLEFITRTIWWNAHEKENSKYSEKKICLSATLSSTYPTSAGRESNQCLHGEGLVTKQAPEPWYGSQIRSYKPIYKTENHIPQYGHARGTQWRSWLRDCSISRKVAGSNPNESFGLGFGSACKRNEYWGYLLGGKSGQCVGLTTLLPSCPDCLEIQGTSNSWNPQGLSRPVR
jgi:hypothetical protein